MSVQDLLNYKAIQGVHDSSGVSANIDGNLFERIEYLVANPGSPTFRKQSGVGTNTTGFLGVTPFVGATATRGVGAFLYGLGTETTTGTVIATWDSTLKMWYHGNTTGVVFNVRYTFGSGVVPFPGGLVCEGNLDGLSFDRDSSAVGLLPDFTKKILTLEFYGAILGAASRDADRGFGWTGNTDGGFSTTYRHVQVWQHSTNGWTITTYDGSTQSNAAEASKTSDNNAHKFRLEWEEGTVRLYVDGTLKITKSTNIPYGGSTGGNPHACVYWGANSADASSSAKMYGWMAYYK